MLRSVNLQRLIYQSYLTSSLVPIFAIELVLLVLYFGINYYLSDRQQHALLAEVTRNLTEISSREARQINMQLLDISRLTKILQQDHQEFFGHVGECHLPHGEPDIRRSESGAWYKHTNNGGGSVYMSSAVGMGDHERWEIRCSEELDALLVAVVESNPLVTQAYLNTHNDMSRIYPFIPNSAEQFGSAMHVADYNFYYLADAQHNPERKTVWTGVYLDPAGQGWMISSIAPVYRGDFLEGVSGLDVTIESFVNTILTVDMPWNASVFMIDANGLIMAMPSRVEDLLGLRELKSHEYQGNIVSTIEKPDEFNLLKSPDPEVRKQMSIILGHEEGIHELYLDGKAFLASTQTVDETGWRIITLVDKQQLLAPIYELQKSSNRIGFIAVSIMVIFYALFFVYLENKSRRLATQLASPIARLSEITSTVGDAIVIEKLESVGISEIDRLYSNFNKMASQLESRTRALIESESREKIRQRETEILERLAITDRLTGLYNRRKLDETLNSELERSLRFHHPFAVVIMDIDHFKSVNDQHGHQVGDQVITELASLMRQSIRRIDIVGRWGGEEFLLICPMTDINGSCQVAENLRKTIQDHPFPVIGRLTVSFGVASWLPGEVIDELLARADKGLYEAKRNGRNRVGLSVPSPRAEDGAYL
jgi:diguanylate cyclase (GGDEF)-like protein